MILTCVTLTYSSLNSEIKIQLLKALESADIKKLITNVGSGVGAAPAAAAAAPAAGGAAPAAGKKEEKKVEEEEEEDDDMGFGLFD